jgi:hypothetical protein
MRRKMIPPTLFKILFLLELEYPHPSSIHLLCKTLFLLAIELIIVDNTTLLNKVIMFGKASETYASPLAAI